MATFLDPSIHDVKGHGFGYFLDPRIYVVTPNEIVGGVICTSMRSCLLASLVDNNNKIGKLMGFCIGGLVICTEIVQVFSSFKKGLLSTN